MSTEEKQKKVFIFCIHPSILSIFCIYPSLYVVILNLHILYPGFWILGTMGKLGACVPLAAVVDELDDSALIILKQLLPRGKIQI